MPKWAQILALLVGVRYCVMEVAVRVAAMVVEREVAVAEETVVAAKVRDR